MSPAVSGVDVGHVMHAQGGMMVLFTNTVCTLRPITEIPAALQSLGGHE